MTTVLYVHGATDRSTGAAGRRHNRTLDLIRQHLGPHGVEVAACVWGDRFGARLEPPLRSVPQVGPPPAPPPSHDPTPSPPATILPPPAPVPEPVIGVPPAPDPPPDDVELELLWEVLVADWLIELRLLSLTADATTAPDEATRQTLEAYDRALDSLPLPENLADRLADLEEARLDLAIEDLQAAQPFQRLISVAHPPEQLAELPGIFARAIVARLIRMQQEESDASPLLQDVALREALVDEIAHHVTRHGGGARGPIASHGVNKLLLPIITQMIQKRRTKFMHEMAFPWMGDILTIQAVGAPARTFIRQSIRALNPPVVILAHSLGGIASVEMLVEEPLPEVELLVTLGSQAPLLYEMDALTQLRRGTPLPAHFPRWLNLWDPHDFFSFLAEPVFADTPSRIEDVAVPSGVPFPEAHSAYWSNPAVWREIVQRLPAGAAGSPR